MANETVSPDGVWVMGSFTSRQWQPEAIQLLDIDGDEVYKATVEAVYGPADIAYKFRNGLETADEEDGDFATGGCETASGV